MNDLTIRTLVVGQLQCNCYLITEGTTKDTIIIDPGDDADYIEDQINTFNLNPKIILATHGHFDHVLGITQLQLNHQIPFLIHQKDVFLLKRSEDSANYWLKTKYQADWVSPQPNGFLDPSRPLNVGEATLEIIETPGHTPGSVCLYLEGLNCLFVGDLIFAQGGVGRTDYSYGNKNDLNKSIQKILTLPKQTIIFPGHGAITTVAEAAIYFNKGAQNAEPPQH